MPQDVVAIWTIAWLAAIVAVVFWRTTIKCLIMLAVIAVVATLAFSVIMLWQLMHYVG